ncbi:MAG TPA: DMT family transporter [Microvirga sp.]|jgi:drug/metabolite transporter (DMT)-like permease|nr:DMT family transporter [Microvirga sp.]
MATEAFLAVLLGALLHASWNAAIKAGRDKLMDAVLVTSGAALLSLLAVPFLPFPAAASWPYLAASIAIHVVYFALVVAAYRAGDMSHAYPLMRGTGPLIVALLSGLVLGEHLPAPAWIGVGLICGSILGMMLASPARGPPSGAATGFALLNAGIIAAYTFVDGAGVRLSGHAVAYTMWVFIGTALPLLAFAAARRPADLAAAVRRRSAVALGGGACSLGSYALALWAMTEAPIAAVAALRESSILFALAIGALVLKEPLRPARLVAGLGIALGVAVLRLAS